MLLFTCCRPAVLYPAVPEVHMDALMKMGENIQAQSAVRHGYTPKDENEEPLKLKSITELTPQEKFS